MFSLLSCYQTPNNIIWSLRYVITVGYIIQFAVVSEPVTPSVSSGPSNILSPSLASEIESLSLANDVPSSVITPVSLYVYHNID